ncbi:hypothetical protein FRC04_011530 [Tulasnella sp. 424]|nr:hypothetical protein FRC04_011530 [Tulasnella sp. 424]KAG8971648.1 hypothetical protein FRC05_010904 [Tulasnella sp. 425]
MALSIVRTLFALAAVVGLASADHNVTVQAWDLTGINYSGCGLGRWSMAVLGLSTLTFLVFSALSSVFLIGLGRTKEPTGGATFYCSAVYVLGTVDCDWSGLINITLDKNTPSYFDRRACVGDICDYPWFLATNLPNTQHTIIVTLTGPPISQAPSKNIIADFRYILYTIPDSSAVTSASASPSGTSTNLPNSDSQHKSVNGGLIGGVVAGVVILVLVVIVIILLLARYRAQHRQPYPIDLGAEQHPLPPSGLTVPQDMTWTPWIPDASQDFGPTPGSQTSKPASRTPSIANLAAPIAVPAAQVPAPSSSSGRDSLYQSERTGSSGPNQVLGNIPPDPLVQRISETVAAILREGTAPPPAYQHPAPAQPPRPRDP